MSVSSSERKNYDKGRLHTPLWAVSNGGLGHFSEVRKHQFEVLRRTPTTRDELTKLDETPSIPPSSYSYGHCSQWYLVVGTGGGCLNYSLPSDSAARHDSPGRGRRHWGTRPSLTANCKISKSWSEGSGLVQSEGQRSPEATGFLNHIKGDFNISLGRGQACLQPCAWCTLHQNQRTLHY